MITKKPSRPNDNSKDKSKDGIEKLIEILDKRISKMVQQSLKGFMNTYKEHPDFKDEKIPFTDDDRAKAENVTDDLEKIVFILGAGTSKTAGLPMASEIIEYCEFALGKKLLTEEVEVIRSNSNNNKESEKIRLFSELFDKKMPYTFEEVLSVYQKVLGSEEAIQLLKEHYLVKEENFPNKTLITLFNECLAHLAREHLVDFIVTFNFDELLELSLKEDIGPNSYVNIMSSAEFKWADSHGLFDSSSGAYSNPEQRDANRGCYKAKLWLLKPHGTISHDNTLRHLIEQVWQFETEKEAVLKRIFKNSHIVVVGYSLSAPDLHRILITNALSGSIKGLYWVNPNEMSGDLGFNLKNTIEKINPGSFFHIKTNADTFALKLFKELYSDDNMKKKGMKEAGLLLPFRHLLRAFAFQKEYGLNCTFENRLILDMIIYSIRMKGWFSSKSVNKCQQINHLINCATHTQRESIKNLPEKLKPFFVSFPRKDRAERIFILRKKFLNRNKSKEDNSRFMNFITPCLITSCISKKMGGCEHKKGCENADGNETCIHEEKMEKTLDWAKLAIQFCERIQGSQDVSPYSNYADFATFNKILIIPNKAVLSALTKWLLSKKSDLHIVSETGGIIIKCFDKGNNEIEKFSSIGLGHYSNELKAIQNELKKSILFESQSFRKWKNNADNANHLRQIIKCEDYSKLKKKLEELGFESKDLHINDNELEEHFYLNDIVKGSKYVEEIKGEIEKMRGLTGKKKKVKFKCHETFRKRFHLNLWKDEANNKVFGILFNRLDRQAGTTFYWIKLDLDDPHEYSQFQAFLKYIKG